MQGKNFINKILFFILLSLPGLNNRALAQYYLYQWENFENRTLPPKAYIIGMERKISIVEYRNIPNMPPEFYHRETGRFGLSIQAETLPQEIQQQQTGLDPYLSGMCFNVLLDRNRIGMNGRALYQADIYFPPGDVRPPNVAVLATSPLSPGDTIPKAIYRFGISGNVRLYFSYVLKDSLEANLIVEDREIFQNIPRPGWHRLSIVFEGLENIYCYIDGRETSFSPVKESSMKQIQLGVLLADFSHDYLCFVDNPSIQWTTEDVPLPDSPYASSWGTEAESITADIMQKAPSGEGDIKWLKTEEGWNRAVQTNTPMLLFLQAPRIPTTLQLNSIFQTNASARNFVQKYVPIKIDVNQLSGGRIAAKFGVFKVPTIVLMDTRGQVIRKATFHRNSTWESLSAELGVN